MAARGVQNPASTNYYTGIIVLSIIWAPIEIDIHLPE